MARKSRQTGRRPRPNFLTRRMALLPSAPAPSGTDIVPPHLSALHLLEARIGLAPQANRPPHAGPTGGAPSRTSGHLAEFTVALQERENWCWAAVSMSVARFLDATSTWTQCSLASDQLGQDCCGDGTACDEQWTLDDPLRAVGCLEGTAEGPTSFEETRELIEAGCPVCCHISWGEGQGGHFVAIGGWTDGASGTRYLDIHDPQRGHTQEVYQNFVGRYRDMGVWDYSYYVQKPTA